MQIDVPHLQVLPVEPQASLFSGVIVFRYCVPVRIQIEGDGAPGGVAITGIAPVKLDGF
ncbi:hypothetical protein H8A97_20220 [Bradyrhizobium sp. Arg62]|uniref:hypothetical protein n=1 Tax=Bradyrhizobium TaxID=374 RepID=UPI001E553037|nr:MULTISPECIES: hypothetical protein [Bradyrhizobium]MCC8935736.1 hypothetical protein [Bradyrhizobium ivorense]MCC8947379.1 hypothetical protein [Bradyrhizobium brasilense]